MSLLTSILTLLPAVDKSKLTDTTGTTDIQKSIIQSVEAVKETPMDQLLENCMDKLLIFGLKLLAAILVYFIGGLIIKGIRKLLLKHFTKRETDKSVASFVTSVVTVCLWICVILTAIRLLGIETTSFAALLAAGGVAIGMAMSGTVQNFAGGIMILAFKPFKVGDTIEAQGFTGKVTEMNITSTKLRSLDNKTVILPNGALSNGTISNLFKENFRRVDINVGVEYGCDADKVIGLLLELAENNPHVKGVKDGAPADPVAGLMTLGPSSVDFVLRAYIPSDEYGTAYFDLNKTIYTELPKHGIGFPFPQVSVHMEK